MSFTKISVETTVSADVKKVWVYWTHPDHITKWNFASDNWHCPYAENDLKTGGKFKSVMASKDGKMSFDFEGIYDEVVSASKIVYSFKNIELHLCYHSLPALFGREYILSCNYITFKYRSTQTHLLEREIKRRIARKNPKSYTNLHP